MTLSGLPEQIDGARQDAVSADGLVTATVDGAGHVMRITLDPKAMRLSADVLAATVTDVVRAAQDSARRALASILAESGAASVQTDELTQLAGELAETASRRLADISSTLDRLLSRDSNGR